MGLHHRIPDSFGIVGTRIDQRYDVSEVVGEGGYGVVYRATNAFSGLPVALKCLWVRDGLSEDERQALLKTLQREAKTLTALSSRTDGIPRAYDGGVFQTSTSGWVPYMVTEWLEGETLERYLPRTPRGVPAHEALELLEPIANGLALAHEQHIAHRDIKPSNIFLVKRRDGSVQAKLLDFGVAKVLEEHEFFSHNRVTTTPLPKFTPAYGAPEQFDPVTYGSTGSWTDVFALGLVLVEVLTGRRALSGKNPMALRADAERIGARLHEMDLSLPTAAIRSLAGALRPHPLDRPKELRAFWQEFAAAERRQPETGGRHPSWPAGPPSSRVSKPEAGQWPPSFAVFCAYSAYDADLQNDMLSRLAPLGIATWYWRRITKPWNLEDVSPDLARSKVILLLLTPEFVRSGYCSSAELRVARESHEHGDVHIVPLLMRRIAGYAELPFGDIVPVPRFLAPVTSWQKQQDAWADVMESLRIVLTELQGRTSRRHPAQPKQCYELDDVFTVSRPPRVTFVETDAYRKLCRYLRDPGTGLAIAGPSGVGKTAALRRAIEEGLRTDASSPLFSECAYLTALSPGDQHKINKIDSWHKRGIVAIDDFHRLPPKIVRRVGDYMKYLADTEATDRKLVVVGIPGSGQPLVDYDVVMRITTLRFGRTPGKDVLRLLELGEEALGITIARKSELVIASAGSFNIAQFLCCFVCEQAGVERTKTHPCTVRWELAPVLKAIMERLAKKVEVIVTRFGGLVQDDLTAIELLKELPSCDDGNMPLTVFQGSRGPAFGARVRRLQGEIARLYHHSPPDDQLHRLLFFNSGKISLIVEDPQILFYFAHIDFRDLARLAGKGAAVDRLRVVVHRSRHDEAYEQELIAQLHPLSSDIDLRVAETTSGQSWQADLETAFEYAKVAVLIVTENYIGTFVSHKDELAWFLDRRSAAGVTILPVPLADTAAYRRFFSADIVPVHAESSNRQKLWATVVDRIRDHLHAVDRATPPPPLYGPLSK